MKRESFKSRLGFLLVSAGCAIGIGNVWRFPYVAGQNTTQTPPPQNPYDPLAAPQPSNKKNMKILLGVIFGVIAVIVIAIILLYVSFLFCIFQLFVSVVTAVVGLFFKGKCPVCCPPHHPNASNRRG